MAFNKKKVDEIGEFLQSASGNYLGQDVPQETLDLVADLTIGDLIVEFGYSVDDASQVLRNIVIARRKNTSRGFRANEMPVTESKLINRLRRVIRECECEEEYSPTVEQEESYHPIPNEMGGAKFEDSGAGEQTGMIKSNLFSIASKAQSLHDKIGDSDSLPEWVQEKIAVADNMIDVISDYLKYEYTRK